MNYLSNSGNNDFNSARNFITINRTNYYYNKSIFHSLNPNHNVPLASKFEYKAFELSLNTDFRGRLLQSVTVVDREEIAFE